MSISRFRHTQCVPARHDRQFFDVNPTGAIWDCGNIIACNDFFIAVPWAQSGTTAVLRHSDCGRVAPNPPLLTGQEAPIIDVAFNPFDHTKLFTASEDGTIMGWDIPEEGLTQSTSENIVHLRGHSKKVGIMKFHPSACNVLASAGADMIVSLWDVAVGRAAAVLKCHNDQIMALDWNLDGKLLCSTSKDKRLNIIDVRQGDIVLSDTAHEGNKTQRCLWAKRLNIIITTGFDKSQGRQIMLWDTRNMSSALQTQAVDHASSVMLPLFDEDINMLYVGGKGDRELHFYEMIGEKLVSCTSYTNAKPLKGVCMLPKWSLDTRQCEISRLCALTNNSVYTIQLLLPRRLAESEFQNDVYPPTFADKPALTAEEYFNGDSSEPLVMDMRAVFDGSERVASRASDKTPSKIEHVDATLATDQILQGTSVNLAIDTPVVDCPSVLPGENTGAVEGTTGSLGELLLELKRQQEGVIQCRAELEEKERCMMETISKIHLLAAGRL